MAPMTNDAKNYITYNLNYLFKIAEILGFNGPKSDLISFLISKSAELKLYISLGNLPGFSLFHDEGTDAMRTNIMHPVFNCALSFSKPSVSSIAKVQEFFTGVPYLWVFENSQVDLESELKKRDLSAVGTCTGMLLNLEIFTAENTVPEIKIKKITAKEDLSHWVNIVEKVQNLSAQFLTPFAEKLFENTDSHSYFYLGYWQDLPVATSLCTIKNGVVALYSVTTLPEYRKRGIGYAVSQQPLIDAQQIGARVATLSATDLGKSVYQKIGFKEYCVYNIFLSK